MITHDRDLSIEFCGVRLASPFLLSAAPPTDDLDMVRAAFEAGWAGAVLKTTSVEAEPVNLVYPMMSALHCDGARIVGLGNIDLISEHHIDVVEKRARTLKDEYPDHVVAVSIMGSRKEEWQELVKRLEGAGVDRSSAASPARRAAWVRSPGPCWPRVSKPPRWWPAGSQRPPSAVRW